VADVVVPALADQGHRRRAGFQQGAQVGVVLAQGGLWRVLPKAASLRGAQIHAPGPGEELGVLGVGTGPAAFDVMDAEIGQALGDGELVVDGEEMSSRCVPSRRVVSYRKTWVMAEMCGCSMKPALSPDRWGHARQSGAATLWPGKRWESGRHATLTSRLAPFLSAMRVEE
jgi:hypothetical protein